MYLNKSEYNEITGIIEMKAQSFRFGMKFRPLGKDQNGLNIFDIPSKLWYNIGIKLADISSVIAPFPVTGGDPGYVSAYPLERG